MDKIGKIDEIHLGFEKDLFEKNCLQKICLKTVSCSLLNILKLLEVIHAMPEYSYIILDSPDAWSFCQV